MIFVGIFFLLWTVSSATSVGAPYCGTKQRCDELWEVPNISNCVDNVCKCTGGSEFNESLQTCTCRHGHVVGSTKCLPAATERGSPCRETVQCTSLGEYAICDERECHCSRDAVAVNGTCRKKKYPSEDCQSDEECAHVSNMLCRRNKCVCDEGNFLGPDNWSCLPRLNSMWDHCEHDIQCSESFGEGSHCRTRCICKDGFQELNSMQCVRNRGMVEVCSTSSNCYEDMTCIGGKCVNKTGATNNPKASSSAGMQALTSPKLLVLLAMFLILYAFLPVSPVFVTVLC